MTTTPKTALITGITGQLGFQAAPPKFIDAIGDADSGKLGVVV